MLRLAAALVVVLSLSGCKKDVPKPKPPKVGEACTDEDKLTCLSPTEAIVCAEGKYETMPCRDTKCSGGSMGDICSNATYLPGEYCALSGATDDFRKHDCSVDHKSQLQCVGKHWKLEKQCPGRYGCRRVEERFGTRGRHQSVLKCDESVVEKGAACPTENAYVCAFDFKSTRRCTSGKWSEDQTCRGPLGCKEEGATVHCDDTLAEAGDACGEDGDQACATDKKARLVCKGNKMVVDKRCPSGCTVITGKVRAGRQGPSFECK